MGKEQTMPEEQTLEELFGKLDEIVAGLEDSSVSLEDSFKAYEEGVTLLKL